MKRFKASEEISIVNIEQEIDPEEIVVPADDNDMSEEVFEKVMMECWSGLVADINVIKTDIKCIKRDIQEIKSLLTNDNRNISASSTDNAIEAFQVIGSASVANEILLESSIETVQELSKKHSQKIPFDNTDDFFRFDNELNENESLRNDVSNVLQTCLDPKNVISKSFVGMLKMFFIKKVAIQFVATRGVENKFIMKTTNFFQIMQDLVKQRRQMSNIETTEKEIRKGLTDVLSNTYNWNKCKKSLS